MEYNGVSSAPLGFLNVVLGLVYIGMDVYLNSTCSVCPKQTHNVSKHFKQWYTNNRRHNVYECHMKSVLLGWNFFVVYKAVSCPRFYFH